MSQLSPAWSSCRLVSRGGGWWLLSGVPSRSLAAAASRLRELGASQVVVQGVDSVRFRAAAGSPVVERLVSVFGAAMA